MTRKAGAPKEMKGKMTEDKIKAVAAEEEGKPVTARNITDLRRGAGTGRRTGPRLIRSEEAEWQKKTRAAVKKMQRKSEQERSRKENETAGGKTKRAKTERKPKKKEKCGKEKRKKRKKKRKLLRNSERCV